MFEKLKQIESRYQELEKLLGDPDVIGDQKKYQKLAKEFSDMTPIIEVYRVHQDHQHPDLDQNQQS